MFAIPLPFLPKWWFKPGGCSAKSEGGKCLIRIMGFVSAPLRSREGGRDVSWVSLHHGVWPAAALTLAGIYRRSNANSGSFSEPAFAPSPVMERISWLSRIKPVISLSTQNTFIFFPPPFPLSFSPLYSYCHGNCRSCMEWL